MFSINLSHKIGNTFSFYRPLRRKRLRLFLRKTKHSIEIRKTWRKRIVRKTALLEKLGLNNPFLMLNLTFDIISRFFAFFSVFLFHALTFRVWRLNKRPILCWNLNLKHPSHEINKNEKDFYVIILHFSKLPVLPYLCF